VVTRTVRISEGSETARVSKRSGSVRGLNRTRQHAVWERAVQMSRVLTRAVRMWVGVLNRTRKHAAWKRGADEPRAYACGTDVGGFSQSVFS